MTSQGKKAHKGMVIFLQTSLEPVILILTFVKFRNYFEVLHNLSRYYETSAVEMMSQDYQIKVGEMQVTCNRQKIDRKVAKTKLK